jgi:hypothetical protein
LTWKLQREGEKPFKSTYLLCLNPLSTSLFALSKRSVPFLGRFLEYVSVIIPMYVSAALALIPLSRWSYAAFWASRTPVYFSRIISAKRHVFNLFDAFHTIAISPLLIDTVEHVGVLLYIRNVIPRVLVVVAYPVAFTILLGGWLLTQHYALRVMALRKNITYELHYDRQRLFTRKIVLPFRGDRGRRRLRGG